jgi:hypothetical protein
MTQRCSFLLAAGIHLVACGVPAVAIIMAPTSQETVADTPCCLPHGHAAARLYPGARWGWLTTTIVKSKG